jgi:hypothetical protein
MGMVAREGRQPAQQAKAARNNSRQGPGQLCSWTGAERQGRTGRTKEGLTGQPTRPVDPCRAGGGSRAPASGSTPAFSYRALVSREMASLSSPYCRRYMHTVSVVCSTKGPYERGRDMFRWMGGGRLRGSSATC